MNMNKFLLGATTLLFATVACADIPQLNYDCPTNIAVHADEGGPVFINGKETKLKKFNDNAYEAKGSGVVISLTRNPDESWGVSYTGKGGANGVCKPATSGGTPATSKAEEACLTEVAKQTGLATSKLSVTDVMTAEAGIGVTINVPGADAPWSCLSDESGKIQGASYTGSEGKL